MPYRCRFMETEYCHPPCRCMLIMDVSRMTGCNKYFMSHNNHTINRLKSTFNTNHAAEYEFHCLTTLEAIKLRHSSITSKQTSICCGLETNFKDTSLTTTAFVKFTCNGDNEMKAKVLCKGCHQFTGSA